MKMFIVSDIAFVIVYNCVCWRMELMHIGCAWFGIHKGQLEVPVTCICMLFVKRDWERMPDINPTLFLNCQESKIVHILFEKIASYHSNIHTKI